MAVVDAAEPAEGEEATAAAATTAEASAATAPAEDATAGGERGEAAAREPTAVDEAMPQAPLTPRIKPREEQSPGAQEAAQADVTDHVEPTA